MQEIKVTITKYKSDTGIIYDNQEDALIDDDVHKGIKEWCYNCKGLGLVEHCMLNEMIRCSMCNDKKYKTLN